MNSFCWKGERMRVVLFILGSLSSFLNVLCVNSLEVGMFHGGNFMPGLIKDDVLPEDLTVEDFFNQELDELRYILGDNVRRGPRMKHTAELSWRGINAISREIFRLLKIYPEQLVADGIRKVLFRIHPSSLKRILDNFEGCLYGYFFTSFKELVEDRLLKFGYGKAGDYS